VRERDTDNGRTKLKKHTLDGGGGGGGGDDDGARWPRLSQCHIVLLATHWFRLHTRRLSTADGWRRPSTRWRLMPCDWGWPQKGRRNLSSHVATYVTHNWCPLPAGDAAIGGTLSRTDSQSMTCTARTTHTHTHTHCSSTTVFCFCFYTNRKYTAARIFIILLYFSFDSIWLFFLIFKSFNRFSSRILHRALLVSM